MTAIGVVTRNRPDDRAPPIVADPDGTFDPEGVGPCNLVGDELREGVVLQLSVDRGPSIPSLIRCDATRAETAERPELMAPAQAQFGPTVDERDRPPVLGAAGPVEGRVPTTPGKFDGVLGDCVVHGGKGSLGLGVAVARSRRRALSRSGAVSTYPRPPRRPGGSVEVEWCRPCAVGVSGTSALPPECPRGLS